MIFENWWPQRKFPGKEKEFEKVISNFCFNSFSLTATHIRIFHTHELCDLCGKEIANSQSLALHMTSYHQPKKPNSWFCEVCGKGYSSKNILDKHVKRHYKENSLVNKWMHDSPNEYKYECTKHNNCKKYFKTEAQFKRHMKTFATRDHLLQNFFPLTDKAVNYCYILLRDFVHFIIQHLNTFAPCEWILVLVF